MVRQSAVERSSQVALAAPLLVEALGYVAHPPIRNSGTVGGSLAHADPPPNCQLSRSLWMPNSSPPAPPGPVPFPRPSFSAGRSPPLWSGARSSPRYAFGAVGRRLRIRRVRPDPRQLRPGWGRGRDRDGEGHCHRSVHRAERGRADPVRAAAAERALAGTSADAAAIEVAVDAAATRSTPLGTCTAAPLPVPASRAAACAEASNWRSPALRVGGERGGQTRHHVDRERTLIDRVRSSHACCSSTSCARTWASRVRT